MNFHDLSQILSFISISLLFFSPLVLRSLCAWYTYAVYNMAYNNGYDNILVAWDTFKRRNNQKHHQFRTPRRNKLLKITLMPERFQLVQQFNMYSRKCEEWKTSTRQNRRAAAIK